MNVYKLAKTFYRNLLGYVYYTIKHLFEKNTLKVYWFNRTSNFGDTLNKELIYLLTKKRISWINPRYFNKKNYVIMGSLLTIVNKKSIVWGTGFMYENSVCYEAPLKVCAVRGPLSRQKLLDSGIECPEVYGDPALLLPLVYNPNIKKSYKVGIIPHFHDKNSNWLSSIKDPSIKILDIQTSDSLKFIDEILSCEKIISSSLHGLIVADAYGISSLWVEFSNKVEGDGFKFKDYFLSVNRSVDKAIKVNKDTTLEELLNSFENYKIEIDLFKLLEAAPFELNSELKNKLKERIK